MVTLAGLLFFEGIMIELATIDKQAVGGVISVSTTSPVFKLVNANISVAASWIGLSWWWSRIRGRDRYAARRAAEHKG